MKGNPKVNILFLRGLHWSGSRKVTKNPIKKTCTRDISGPGRKRKGPNGALPRVFLADLRFPRPCYDPDVHTIQPLNNRVRKGRRPVAKWMDEKNRSRKFLYPNESASFTFLLFSFFLSFFGVTLPFPHRLFPPLDEKGR